MREGLGWREQHVQRHGDVQKFGTHSGNGLVWMEPRAQGRNGVYEAGEVTGSRSHFWWHAKKRLEAMIPEFLINPHFLSTDNRPGPALELAADERGSDRDKNRTRPCLPGVPEGHTNISLCQDG